MRVPCRSRSESEPKSRSKLSHPAATLGLDGRPGRWANLDEARAAPRTKISGRCGGRARGQPLFGKHESRRTAPDALECGEWKALGHATRWVSRNAGAPAEIAEGGEGLTSLTRTRSAAARAMGGPAGERARRRSLSCRRRPQNTWEKCFWLRPAATAAAGVRLHRRCAHRILRLPW